MHPLDTAVVSVYLLLTLALGIHLARRVRSSEDLFLAGRSLPFWAIGMSLVVSDIGALEMIGGTAGAFSHGVAQANFEWIGCVPAMVVGALVFIPLFWRLGIYSIPEFLGQRYGATVHTVLAIVAVVFMSAAIGIFLHASAEMFRSVLGWERWVSVSVTAGVVAVYTVGGGLRAVVVTDVVQCVVLFVGGLALAAAGLAAVGGWSGLTGELAALEPRTQHHLTLLQPLAPAGAEQAGYPWTGTVLGLGLVLSPAYWFGNQAIVQRTLGAKNAWHARAGMLFGAGLKTFVPLAFVLPGLCGVVLLEGRAGVEPNGVYPSLIEELLPAGLRGVLYAAFLAALMSSVDSYANSAATVLTRDLYGRLGRRARGATSLRFGRLASLAVLGCGVGMVPLADEFETIYEAFQSYLSFFQGPTLALLIGAVAWRRANPIGGVLGLIGGIGCAAALHLRGDVHWLHIAFWSFVAALALLAAGGFIGRRKGDAP